jgi:GTPase SAR1 family protein
MSTSLTSSTLGKKTHKIIFLGDSGTGKTSIIGKFVSNEF